MAIQRVTESVIDTADTHVELDYDFDDVSLVIQNFYLINTGTLGKLTVTIKRGGTTIWGPQSQDFGAGTATFPVAVHNWLMIKGTGKGGVTTHSLPAEIDTAWDSTA